MSLFFHYALSPSCISELARSYTGFTKLRCTCSWYVSCMCQVAVPVGMGEENVTHFTSLPNKGTPGVLHGEEIPAWESSPVVLLLPCMGYIWGGELPYAPLWHHLFGVAWPGCLSCIQPWGFLSVFPQDVFLVLGLPLVLCNVWALGASWEMAFSSSCPEHHYVCSGPYQSFPWVHPLAPRSIIQQICVLASSVPKLLGVP